MEPEIHTQTNEDAMLINRCRAKPQLLSINDIQAESGSSCGYCHKSNGNVTWSFTKSKMEPYTYELMMERGWRRCGTYYYKPNLIKSCCKLFTHRLQAAKFKPKKDQRKALKKVISLAYQRVEAKQIKQNHKIEQQKTSKNKEKQQKATKIVEEIAESVKSILQNICMQLIAFLRQKIWNLLKDSGLTQANFPLFNFQIGNKLKFFVSKPNQKFDYYSNFVMLLFGINKKLFGSTKYGLLDFSKDVKGGIEGVGIIEGFEMQVQRGGYLLFKVADKSAVDKSKKTQVQYKQEQARQHIQDILLNNSSHQITQKVISQIKTTEKHHNFIEVESRGHHKQNQQKQPRDQPFQAGLQFQGQINITSTRVTFGKITIDIVPAQQTQQSFRLYQKYTKQIHQKKQKAMNSYVNFLCLHAINARTETSTIPEHHRQKYIASWDPSQKHQSAKSILGQMNKLLGCYHMKYFFQQRLIAVGVVDLVDHGLSSVYFFYDPAYKDYRLGVFSSLIQIEYVRWMNLSFPEFRYYYMGYYIPNNEKMNYKNDYSPCQLLCPETYQFVQFDENLKEKTDKIAAGKEKSIRLAAQGVKINEDMSLSNSNIGPLIDSRLKLKYKNNLLQLKQINPVLLIKILQLMKNNLPVWGKKLFDIFTFTL